MWKRERMMIDVVSTCANNEHQDKAPLQNRQFYPIGGGMLHDDVNSFYNGNEYTIHGDLISQKSKRPPPNNSNLTNKKQKVAT